MWYVLPISSVLFADPLLGAVILSTYAAVRTGAVWLLLGAQAKSPSLELDAWLAGHRSHARMVSGLLLCVSAAATSFVVGL